MKNPTKRNTLLKKQQHKNERTHGQCGMNFKALVCHKDIGHTPFLVVNKYQQIHPTHREACMSINQ